MSDSTNQAGQSAAAPSYFVTVPLSPIAIEMLEQLFIHGPTWDGNVISKCGRDELFDVKLATRVEGYSFLTAAGVRMALANRLDRKKERRSRERSVEVDKYRRIAEIVMPTDSYSTCTNAQDKQVSKPTAEELGMILGVQEPRCPPADSGR